MVVVWCSVGVVWCSVVVVWCSVVVVWCSVVVVGALWYSNLLYMVYVLQGVKPARVLFLYWILLICSLTTRIRCFCAIYLTSLDQLTLQ